VYLKLLGVLVILDELQQDVVEDLSPIRKDKVLKGGLFFVVVFFTLLNKIFYSYLWSQHSALVPR